MSGAPTILTTVVGSYPVPSWLRGASDPTAHRDALLAVLKTQELAGLDVVADGELSRFDPEHPETNGMIDAFVQPLAGVHVDLSEEELAEFGRRENMGFRRRPAGVVRGPVAAGSLDLPGEWKKVRCLTRHPLKLTVTSPYMLARTLLDCHYGDARALTLDLAHALAGQVAKIDGAAVIQVDEAHLTGHPEDSAWAAEPLNVVLDAISCEKALHLCFGNYGGHTIQKGFFRDLLPFLNEIHADHLVLEFARRGPAELPVFNDLREDLALGIGVIDIKDPRPETPDQVARRVETAVNTLGIGRVRWIHPDCGFWMLTREASDQKMAALVKGRDQFLGRRG